MKKILCLLLVLMTFVNTICFAESKNIDDMTVLLTGLNILKGDPDGNLRLDDSVSRAEFTKIAVLSSSFKNSVATNLTISPFKDVLYTHWAAPYIKLAVSNQICKGYPNGRFDPDGIVLYEEAVTMMLKVLGYTDSDFGISWPYGQLGLADHLEITKNISKGVGQILTRRDVITLVYNTLDTKLKGSNQKLISVFDCQIIENAILIATNKEDSSVGINKVVTTSGTYEYNNDFNLSNIGRKGDLIIKNGEDLIAFIPENQVVQTYQVTEVIGSDLVLNDQVFQIDDNLKTFYKSQTTTYKNSVSSAEEGDTFVTFLSQSGAIDYAMLLSTHSKGMNVNVNALEKYVVYTKLENAIVGYRNSSFHQIDIKDSTVCYKDQIKTTYLAIKSELSLGDLIYVKMDGADIEYVSYEKGTITGPITVKSSDWSNEFQLSNDVAIMRNEKKASLSDIKVNDILYYSKDLNMVLSYSNKVTGVYEKAIPNKDMPSGVVISGVTYQVESVTAFNKLSSKGSFEYGDTVTILLGKTKQIADVISPASISSTIYGYLIETGSKEFVKSDNTRYTYQYIKAVLPSGELFEYTTEKDYKEMKNSPVSIRFSNGMANVSRLDIQSNISGVFDWKGKQFGNFKLSPNINILDIGVWESSKNASYTTVFPQRINQVEISSSNVWFFKTNENNEIETLILKNVTGDSYQYGMVTKSENQSKGIYSVGSYSYDIGGRSKSFVTSNSLYTAKKGQAAKFTFTKLGEVDTMENIKVVEGSIANITETTLTADNTTYLLSDKVVVYKKSYDYDYTIIPLSDLIGNNAYKLTAYYDKSSQSGGRVRVIVVEEK